MEVTKIQPKVSLQKKLIEKPQAKHKVVLGKDNLKPNQPKKKSITIEPSNLIEVALDEDSSSVDDMTPIIINTPAVGSPHKKPTLGQKEELKVEEPQQK